MIELIEVASAAIKQFRNAPGESVVAKGTGLGGATREAQVYQQHGLRSRPVKGTRGLFVGLGSGSREGVVIALENYTLEITIGEGETAIYSTDTAGSVKATAKFKADGSIEFNGDGKRLVTWQELQDALSAQANTIKTHTHPDPTSGSTGPSAELVTLACDISSAKTSTLKTGG